MSSGYYPPGVTTLPGEEPPTHVICPVCARDYELYEGWPAECDCGHRFDGTEETR